ncbi:MULTISPECIES: LysR family transcriptional regulator [unclassified Mesorhizobium]|uniref:LysR family transcriptional regulator n=1 Tax=unclassified Mesorhizobium TaxID=325217 RepID=UPI000FCA662D|nr:MULTISPECIES: LysR family transcriptional regulator [unclassified Mesorhizobium]RUX04142.1 LysR family transcriptional regulator [Mesorhizobium sp. M8A.F.Ca.ET.023.01.1.1]TGR42792.1 LysR family transcriptional regulator [bacterium M00.F.Ca.ET.199.01.1.1]TGU30037.1 LysR family transcriptional regulator [bacterium M00.F.Ca.ET.156.01.1.1]TGV09028.1 LysR family transcriptional regulator [Mesorhizobium sp. M8A.F.Ca.ET.173.01.1.1]TGV51090.1 LysR family transcriptional regulator [bacterium M00.F.C
MDLNALSVFALVAEERSFRAAADRLGVTRSAVSQTIRRLEETIGIALVRRTTRSVSLTEAGERLRAEIAPAIADMRAAVEAAGSLRGRPRGQLRLAVSSIAEGFLSGPFLAAFAEANPEVQIDITVTDDEFDIVAQGYDAGVRLGEVIEQDMIAVPVAGDERQLAVCAPAYRDRFGEPAHPSELAARRCIGWRPAPGVAPYRWEFAVDGKEFSVAVAPEITTNDMTLMIRLAVAGAGITFGMERSFRPWLDRGELVPILESYCPRFAGFYLYYPGRRNLAPKLRALVDHLQRFR